MTNSDIEKNILVNYDVFLIEQLIIFRNKSWVDELVQNYENNYKAYYSKNWIKKQNSLWGV